MYVPPLFRQSDATVPMLLIDDASEHGRLIGHLARANPQAETLDGAALVTIVADDAYIQPGWYASTSEHGRVVPTWNYVAVHARGRGRRIDDPAELRALVERLTNRFERESERPWQVDDAPRPFVDAMLRRIVGFEIAIESMEAKWKLGQDETADDIAGAIAGLERSPDARDRAAALRMKTVDRPSR